MKTSILDRFAADAINAPETVTGGHKDQGNSKNNTRKSGTKKTRTRGTRTGH